MSIPIRDKSLHGLVVAFGIVGTIAGVVVAFAYAVSDSGIADEPGLQARESEVAPVDNPAFIRELTPLPPEDPDSEIVNVETISQTRDNENDVELTSMPFPSLNYSGLVSNQIVDSQETNVTAKAQPQGELESQVVSIPFTPISETQEETEEKTEQDYHDLADEDSPSTEAEPSPVAQDNDQPVEDEEPQSNDDSDDGGGGKKGNSDHSRDDSRGKGKAKKS